MSRKTLSLGASVLTLTLACASYAEAQQNLPTINVGGATKRRASRLPAHGQLALVK